MKPANLHILLLAIITLSIGIWIPRNLSVTLSPSMVHRVYWINKSPKPEKLMKDRCVMFSIVSDVTKNLPTTRVIKRIACAGGDRLTTEAESYFCNGIKIGVFPKDRKTQFVFNGVIPSGQLFMLGDRPDISYDSRFWGFLPNDKVIAIVSPIM